MAATDRGAVLGSAAALLGVPYAWGGDDPMTALDCSSYLSRCWGVPRQTTDTLASVADPIAKSELLPGDALNLPTWADPRGFGHCRLFAGWAGDRVDVFEETAELGTSVHRVVPYDDRFQPMRLRGLGGAVAPGDDGGGVGAWPIVAGLAVALLILW